MTGITKTRNSGARTAFLAVLGLLLTGGLATVASTQQPAKPKSHAAAREKVTYKSSIQVPYDSAAAAKEEALESHEGRKAHEAREQAESARYEKLARITADQARSAALAKVPGTVRKVELENEAGNLVYNVKVKTSTGGSRVTIDAGNGNVLQVRQHHPRH